MLSYVFLGQGEKLYAKTLPYPFASKDVFEQSIRMPIGPEFNPALVAGALTRPEVSSSFTLTETQMLLLEDESVVLTISVLCISGCKESWHDH